MNNMPARTRKVKHDDLTREKIRTSQLLNRLHDHVFGKGGEEVELSQTQMKAIEILLRKSLPDLSAVTLSGDANNPLQLVNRIERVIVTPSGDVADRDTASVPTAH